MEVETWTDKCIGSETYSGSAMQTYTVSVWGVDPGSISQVHWWRHISAYLAYRFVEVRPRNWLHLTVFDLCNGVCHNCTRIRRRSLLKAAKEQIAGKCKFGSRISIVDHIMWKKTCETTTVTCTHAGFTRHEPLEQYGHMPTGSFKLLYFYSQSACIFGLLELICVLVVGNLY